MSTREQRQSWRLRAQWLTQLGLTDDEPAPVEAVEEVAYACLSLLEEVRRLELERAEARALAWFDHHRWAERWWFRVAGCTYDGDEEDLPEWLQSSVKPPAQDWWPD